MLTAAYVVTGRRQTRPDAGHQHVVFGLRQKFGNFTLGRSQQSAGHAQRAGVQPFGQVLQTVGPHPHRAARNRHAVPHHNLAGG